MNNLCNRPVYRKGTKRTKANKPTAKQLARWQRLKDFGCSVQGCLSRVLETHQCV